MANNAAETTSEVASEEILTGEEELIEKEQSYCRVDAPGPSNEVSMFDKEMQKIDTARGDDSTTTDVTDSKRSYNIKWIDFHGALYGIMMQNENGPCPLLAISNVLLLRGQICFPTGAGRVSEEDLLEILANCLLRFKPKDLDALEELNYEQNVSDALTLVPLLPRGLDVNIQFNGVEKFEYTPSCALFDLLGISLVHGWIVDPLEIELAARLDGIGYNQLVEKIVKSNDTDSCILREFIENTSSQLTEHGIQQLHSFLSEDEVAVLFRNNHFHTLYKHDGDLYDLVTDMGFYDQPKIVWETFKTVDGNSVFVDAYFNARKDAVEVVEAQPESSDDYCIALSMQEDEDRREGENISKLRSAESIIQQPIASNRKLPEKSNPCGIL